MISSVEDLRPQPSDALLTTAIEAASAARQTDLSQVVHRCRTALQRDLVQQWPGEHYRLLAGMMAVLQPPLVVEVGTFTGMGALSLAAGAERVVTYDVVPWDIIPETLLSKEDFGPRLEQRLGDLSNRAFFEQELETLRSADLIFVDGPKDGIFEPAFADLLLPALSGTHAFLVFDDIRVINMVQFWRDLPAPKLDLTSFGHWSGTGLAVVE